MKIGTSLYMRLICSKIEFYVLLVALVTQFPEAQCYPYPIVSLNFIAESRSEILFYPNPEHEFEFYPTLTRVYFILSPKFYHFIQKLRR